MPDERIKNFLESSAGEELKKVLVENVLKLENIQNLKGLDNPEELAVEIKAQQKAAQILRDILSQFIDFEQGRKKGEKDRFYVGL